MNFGMAGAQNTLGLVAEQSGDRGWGMEEMVRKQNVEAGEATSEGLL